MNVVEESDEEDREARDQCQTEEVRSRQGETEEQTQVEDQVEERTFYHQHGDGSQGARDDANQEVREPQYKEAERSTETGRSERVEDRENTSVECEGVLAWPRERRQGQLSFPAMQVTSSHVSIWFVFPASY